MRLDGELRAVLRPLLELLRASGGMRLIARSGRVWLDRAEGAAEASVAWDGQAQQTARALLGDETRRSEEGLVVRCLGETLVLRAPPPDRHVEDLAREGFVSTLAARTLSAAAGLGRNVLVVGPQLGASALIAALVAEGRRPCIIGPFDEAVPPSWPLLESGSEARCYGADRLGAWSLSATAAGCLMRECSGVIAWIDARRLAQALARFEAALVAGAPAVAAPLQVLAAVDLVVVVAAAPRVRVTEIAEIAIVEEGYRPRFLFASGLPPVAQALVPVGLPSFLQDLLQAGFGVLVDELRHASPPPAVAGVSAAGPKRDLGVGSGARPSEPIVPPLPSTLDPDAPPPGWELDRLGDGDLIVEAPPAASDDATLAATFGLAPPPRPAGMQPIESRSFEEALQRARERAGEGETD